MLRILRLPARAAIAPLLQNFDPKQATWIVSDLRSKFEMQKILLEKQDGYLDADILRASDLWKNLLKRARPEMRLISRDFARSLVHSFLRAQKENLQLDVVSEKSVLSAMDRFAGVVFHPGGSDTVEELFAENPQSSERWGKTFAVAKAALEDLRSKNLFIAPWAAALLQTEEGFSSFWKKPLIVDLGAEMTGAEAQLFRELAREIDVTLIEPAPSWRKESEALLRPYQDVEGYAAEIRDLPWDFKEAPHRETLRFSGALAEVKAAVSRARRWAEEGVELEKMAILAPDIEEYWPVLRAYLEEEGLASDKAISVKLNSLPGIARWLSRLRPHRGELTAADLELSFYGQENSQRLRSEEFQSLFTHLYGEEDLVRHPDVIQFFKDGPKFKDRLKRDEFLLSSVPFWDRREDLGPLILVAREVLQNAPPETELPLPDWIRYLESVAASKETGLAPATAGGILVTNFLSARVTRTSHRIFLGLSEESLKKVERNPLPLKDVRELSDLGFHLDHPDHSLLEFELRWLSESGTSQDLFFVGNSGFDGGLRAPSALWLQWSQELHGAHPQHESVSVPDLTRWDCLQKTSFTQWSKERDWSQDRSESLEGRLRLDLGETSPDFLKVDPPSSISPSFVRRYLDCPFIVAGTSLFRLKDLEEIDLDLARSDSGTLTHAVFQAMTDGGWLDRPEVNEEELTSLVEKIRAEKNFVLGEEKLWGPFLKRQVRTATEFFRVEKAWQKSFPLMTLLPSESLWALWFDPADGSFHREESPGRVKLTGRIDRLETDGKGRYVVVDYKAGASSLTNQNRWIEENELQLLFYLWAVERGALQGIAGRGIGAFYYVYRDFSRHRGLQIEDEAGVLYPTAGRRKNLGVDEARKKELFALLEEKIKEVLMSIQKGKWAPEPRDQQICGGCAWNTLCRAAHLN